MPLIACQQSPGQSAQPKASLLHIAAKSSLNAAPTILPYAFIDPRTTPYIAHTLKNELYEPIGQRRPALSTEQRELSCVKERGWEAYSHSNILAAVFPHSVSIHISTWNVSALLVFLSRGGFSEFGEAVGRYSRCVYLRTWRCAQLLSPTSYLKFLAKLRYENVVQDEAPIQ